MPDGLDDLQSFSGSVRLFPLPNLVLFPYLMQPLHIFEPRYRQMTADALAGDRCIALVLLKPGWEAAYEARPEIHSIACLGKIVGDERLEDGRFNLQVRGLARVRILTEFDLFKPYRSARVELLHDQPVAAPHNDLLLRRRLMGLVPPWCTGQVQALAMLRKVLQSTLPLATIGDVVSFALPLPLEFKQHLLSNCDVEQRVRVLVDYLEENKPAAAEKQAAHHKFPPDFSSN